VAVIAVGPNQSRPARSNEHESRSDAMSIMEQVVEIDEDKLMQFVLRAVGEVGATLNTALVVMGDRLGLYGALAGTDGAVAPR
jgi:hypothetical protein